MLGMCIINFQEILKETLDLMMEEISRKCHNSTELLKEMTQKCHNSYCSYVKEITKNVNNHSELILRNLSNDKYKRSQAL